MRATIKFSLSLVMLVLSCKEADIGPTDECVYTSFPSHPNAAVYQGILDKYVKKGLPGISALVRDDNGTWIGHAGKADIDRNPLSALSSLQSCQHYQVYGRDIDFYVAGTGQTEY